MISFTNSEYVSNMSQKAFKVEFNKTFGGFLTVMLLSLYCKSIMHYPCSTKTYGPQLPKLLGIPHLIFAEIFRRRK